MSPQPNHVPLRVAIIGCGAVAQRLYRQPLQRLERDRAVRVTSLIDPVRAHAEALAASFPSAARYEEPSQGLTTSPADLVLVLSPAHLHHAHAIDALQQGAHVLCEKPLANR